MFLIGLLRLENSLTLCKVAENWEITTMQVNSIGIRHKKGDVSKSLKVNLALQ